MSLEGASKVMSPPVVPHESSEDFLRRMMYHSRELPEAFNFAHEEKIRRVVLMKEVMKKLRNVTAIMIEYFEFLRICIETCENSDKGAELAKLLDHSRNVVFFGNHVILRPEEVYFILFITVLAFHCIFFFCINGLIINLIPKSLSLAYKKLTLNCM